MTLKSMSETEAWARAFARGLTRPTAVLLSGGLGAGKTQITSWCLDELGCADVSSPTFAIHHRYATRDNLVIDHLDLYRVESDSDLEGVGLWDLLADERGLVFIEWADRLPREAYPFAWTRVFIELEVVGEGREVRLTYARPGLAPG